MDARMHRRLTWAQGRCCQCKYLVIQDYIFGNNQGSEANREKINQFLDTEGPPKILVYYQTADTGSENDHNVIDAHLFVTYGDSEKIKDKAVWFLRNLPENKKKVNHYLFRLISIKEAINKSYSDRSLLTQLEY